MNSKMGIEGNISCQKISIYIPLKKSNKILIYPYSEVKFHVAVYSLISPQIFPIFPLEPYSVPVWVKDNTNTHTHTYITPLTVIVWCRLWLMVTRLYLLGLIRSFHSWLLIPISVYRKKRVEKTWEFIKSLKPLIFGKN